MTDHKRLGKRGSYRLGRLRAQGVSVVAPPLPSRPSFSSSRHRGSLALWLAGWVTLTALLAAGAAWGVWFVPYAAGLVAGFSTGCGGWRLRPSLVAVITTALVGWGVPLGWSASASGGQPAGASARAIAELTGRPASALITFAVSLLVAVIQAMAGAWLGRVLAPRPQASPLWATPQDPPGPPLRGPVTPLNVEAFPQRGLAEY
jgi:hypothetical protein